jgi:hypothetical protein
MAEPVTGLTAGFEGRLFVLTPIWAPLGLEDRVRHRWRIDGRVVFESQLYNVTGGRAEGYRLWTSFVVPPLAAGSRVWVDVVTEAGQLVGRATLPVTDHAEPAVPPGPAPGPAPAAQPS